MRVIIVLGLPTDSCCDGMSINKIGRVTPMADAVILLEERHTLYIRDK
jgi:hypothetical protein